jgi:hypothetical protein
MTLNQIWNMVLRIFIRKGVNWGINKGMRHMPSAGRKAAGAGTRQGTQPGGGSPADGAQAHQARELAKRARKAARLTRRTGR